MKPVITSDGPLEFCAGGSVVLTSAQANEYQWSTGAFTESVTVGAEGDYTVRVTDGNGCLSMPSDAAHITVNPLPAKPAVTAGGPLIFCAGGSVSLTSGPGASYQWSNGAGTRTITISETGGYSVRSPIPKDAKAGSSDTLHVNVNPLPSPPVITAGGPITFCDGGAVTLTCDPAYTYRWSDGDSARSIQVGETGSFTVEVTNEYNCHSVSSDPAEITVHSLPLPPKITADGPLNFCFGKFVNLTSDSASAYLWSDGSKTRTMNVTASGSYSVTIFNEYGCQSEPSDTTVVTVHPLPDVPVIIADGPLEFCEGNTVNLSCRSASSYIWSNGGISRSVNIGKTGNYSVRVVNESGCFSGISDPVTVKVDPLPVPFITAGGPLSFCEGGSVTLTAGAGNTFVWSNGATGRSITVTSTGKYSVHVKDENGCSGQATKEVTVNRTPSAWAGPGQELKFIFETQLEADLSRDETGLWSFVEGSGNFYDEHSPVTRVDHLSVGENILLWKVMTGECADSAEVTITVHDLFIPSVITPDGNGKNDYFKIPDLPEGTGILIFNRWGSGVFTTGNYLNNWDGSSDKGIQLPEDTYFYILKFENGRIKKGSVLIKR